MAQALVTGSRERVEAVAAILSGRGLDVVTATRVEDLDGIDLDGLDHYVQLPFTVQPEGDNVVGRVRSFLSAGLLTRYALTERVLGALTPDARVVIVSGTTAGGDGALPDDRHSRLALLRVLAHAVRAEVGPRGVQVDVVSGDRTDSDIAAFAVSGGPDEPSSSIGEPADSVTGKQYEDWRAEMMGIATDQV